MFNRFSPPDTLKNLRFLILVFGRDQEQDWFSDDFFRRVPKQALAPWFQLVMMPLRSLLMMASSEDADNRGQVRHLPFGAFAFR